MSFRTLAVRAGSAANAAGLRTSSFRSSFVMAQQATGLSFGSRTLTTEAENMQELPGDERNDVVFESKYGIRTIMLNRPKKLNSLNASMIRKIVPRLVEWEKSDMANVVVMKGAGEKALCAGGDVAALAKLNSESPEGWKQSADYFALEYKLDHYIATYGKPYIAFMDGITMGGGVGLSVHAPLRIATEKTIFAMPETTIGFFPDVGASFFLPRLNGAVGTYLALTSDRLTGPNVFYTGIATHYLHSTSLPDLEARLAEIRFSDGQSMESRLKHISLTIEEFSTGLPYDQPMQISGELRKAIDRCFSKNSVAEIMSALEEETGETKEWAQKQLETLHKRSPTAVHVALRQMRSAKKWNISETFQKEHKIATQFMKHPDFTEGVTALLVRKEKPTWQPATLEDITSSDEVTKPFFDFGDEKKDSLSLFSSVTYRDYHHGTLEVPKEKEVKKMVLQNQYTPNELVRAVVASRQGRAGIAEVAREIIGRKVATNEEGKATWIEDENVVASKL